MRTFARTTAGTHPRAGIGSAVMLAAVSLAVPGCRRGEAKAVFIDPALVALLPGDTVALAGIRVKELRTTPVYRTLADKGYLRSAEEFASRVGLQGNIEIWEVLLASDGRSTLNLVRGRFSPPGMEPQIKGEQIPRSKYKTHTLYGGDRAAVVFLNSTTAVAGPAPLLHAVIDRRSASHVETPPALKQARSVPAGSQIWVAAIGQSPLLSDAIPETGNLSNLHKVLGSMQGVWAGVKFAEGASTQAEGSCLNEEDAKALGTAIKGIIGLARLRTPDDETMLLRVLDSFQVTQIGTRLQFRADLSSDLLAYFLNKIPPARAGGVRIPARCPLSSGHSGFQTSTGFPTSPDLGPTPIP